MASFFDGLMNSALELIEPFSIRNGPCSINAQTIKTILHQPVQRIIDEEIRHDGIVEINAVAPRCIIPGVEEALGIFQKVISVRPEVIINDIQKDHQSQ